MNFYKDCFILMDMLEDSNNWGDLGSAVQSFKEEYNLSDWDALRIARGDMTSAEILAIGNKLENK